MRISRCVARLLFLVILGAVFSGCGSDGASSAPQVQQGDTQGMILDMVSASTAPDTDGDFLPDDVELYLGTKIDDRDTDRDGLPDFVEIFGYGTMREDKIIENRDKDALIAALDADDDNDGINDGQQVDSDGDGISNYLEYYGYTYNWMSGKYAPWDGTDYTKTYYKTDPHQKSTDQDPFDDNVEVTDVNMDVSVRAPGDLPMVPAYPEIVVQLEGYSVTLNQDVTWSEGSSLSKGTTWEKTAGATFSHTDEKNWKNEIGAKISYGDGFGGEVSFSHGWGGSDSDTAGTSNSVSSGGSVLSEENWTRAVATNPTDAARIKLFLKVFNRGTAVASSVIPTFTLKIGGHNIATFEQGNAQINLLEPGGAYPAAPGIYWVVDSVDTGASVVPISLTLSELRALECGAPVSITVTQVSANVMLRNTSTGVYESAGDWNEYMARIKAVSADLYMDKGDGNIVHGLVYADDRITSPAVTLGDALVWTANGKQDPATGEVFITYYDMAKRVYSQASLSGWSISVDDGTYAENGFSDANPAPADFNIASLRLNPNSFVVAKAPRDQVPNMPAFPKILAAYLDPVTGAVTAVVSDYNGIEKVEFVDSDGNTRIMNRDTVGSAFFVYVPGQDSVNYPDGYTFTGQELVRATNVNGNALDVPFLEIYTAPVPRPPAIQSVSVDLTYDKLYVHVAGDYALDVPPAFVRVYGSAFTTAGGYGDGYCEMKRVINWYEDPTGWVCNLAASWTFTNLADAEVVAYAGPGLYAKQAVDASSGVNYIQGSGMVVGVLPQDHNIWPWPDEWLNQESEMLDMDYGAVFERLNFKTPMPAVSYDPVVAQPVNATLFQSFEMWLQHHNYSGEVWIHFGVAAKYLGLQDTDVDYDSLTPNYIKSVIDPLNLTNDSLVYEHLLGPGSADQVFIYRTSNGKYGKIGLRCSSAYDGNFTWPSGHTTHGKVAKVTYQFLTFP